MNPAVNAIVTLRAGAREAAAARGRRGARARRAGRPAPRAPDRAQGPGAHRGDPHHVRLADLRRPRCPTRTSCSWSAIRDAGAIVVGQDQHPGVRRRLAHLQPGLRRRRGTRTTLDDGRLADPRVGRPAALATGMVPIADGSDLGGSLRNPASFCNVVGFRPSPGRVPSWPTYDAWDDLSVDGPMAAPSRTPPLLLSAMAGPDPRVPISLPEPGAAFAPPLDADVGGRSSRGRRPRAIRCRRPGGRRVVDRSRVGVRGDRLPHRGGVPGSRRRARGLPDAAGARATRPTSDLCSPTTATG